MGNCCECASARSSENLAENLIRNSINQLQIRYMNYTEFHDLNIEQFGMFITEILNQNKSKFFLTKESYEKFINNKIINANLSVDSIRQQKHACLKYSENYFDGLRINYAFSLWSLAHLQVDFESKIEFLFKILKDTEKFVNFKTFYKFLFRYLRINLNLVTKNFLHCEDIMKDSLLYADLKTLNKLFTSNLLEKFLNKVLDSLKINLKMCNENLHSADIENEFLTEVMITSYFRNNSFLLDIIQLRESVYVFTKTITDFSYND